MLIGCICPRWYIPTSERCSEMTFNDPKAATALAGFTTYYKHVQCYVDYHICDRYIDIDIDIDSSARAVLTAIERANQMLPR